VFAVAAGLLDVAECFYGEGVVFAFGPVQADADAVDAVTDALQRRGDAFDDVVGELDAGGDLATQRHEQRVFDLFAELLVVVFLRSLPPAADVVVDGLLERHALAGVGGGGAVGEHDTAWAGGAAILLDDLAARTREHVCYVM
jgi:hypothetical protein